MSCDCAFSHYLHSEGADDGDVASRHPHSHARQEHLDNLHHLPQQTTNAKCGDKPHVVTVTEVLTVQQVAMPCLNALEQPTLRGQGGPYQCQRRRQLDGECKAMGRYTFDALGRVRTRWFLRKTYGESSLGTRTSLEERAPSTDAVSHVREKLWAHHTTRFNWNFRSFLYC